MDLRQDGGIALVVTLMAMVLMMALAAALVLITSSETMIAANFRAGHETLYAADAVLERAFADLRAMPDWSAVLAGGARSSFVDGQPTGVRRLQDGATIDLAVVTNLANCAKSTPCSDADIAARTTERPWGPNNPRWTLFAYGRLADAVAIGTLDSPCYVMAFVGDDASENDGDPRRDGASPDGFSNPGLGIISLRAEAFGSRHAHRVIEATVAREAASLRVISWRAL